MVFHVLYHGEVEQSGDMEMPRRLVGSIDFTVSTLGEATQAILSLSQVPNQHGIAVHCANAYNVALAESDQAYREILNKGDVVFCDGMPVVWAGRRLHPDVGAKWQRVYGPDLMEAVFEGSRSCGPRHYLLGGSPEALQSLITTIQHRWPDAIIVGSESPSFGHWSKVELAQRDQQIQRSQANIVWVGLGTPKQDYEVARIASALPVVTIAVGAAFDFLSGTKPQAPRWMQRSGLEWAFRLSREPRRLMRRYLWGNPVFLWTVLKQAMRSGNAT